MIDAAKLSKLSAPNVSRRVEYTAVDAEPENGRDRISGISPEGIPRGVMYGERSFDNPSAAPLAVNSDSDTSRRTIVGRVLTVVSSPLFAPRMNESSRSLFLMKHTHTTNRTPGITREEIDSAMPVTCRRT